MKTYIARTSNTISASDMADIISTAVEGGISYWAVGFKRISSEHEPTKKPWYADDKLYEGDFVIRVTEDEESKANQGVDHDLTPEKMQAGLDVVAAKYPAVLSDLVTGNYDAGDADTFIQCAIFGETVYA